MMLPSFDAVDDETVAWLQAKTSAELFAMINGLHNWARQMVADGTRTHHPDWDDGAVAQEVARRFISNENLPALFARDLRKRSELEATARHALE